MHYSPMHIKEYSESYGTTSLYVDELLQSMDTPEYSEFCRTTSLYVEGKLQSHGYAGILRCLRGDRFVHGVVTVP